MVNAEREVDRSRELLDVAMRIRDRTNEVKELLRRELDRSKELQAEVRWLRFFEHSEQAMDFLRRLDDQCIKPGKN